MFVGSRVTQSWLNHTHLQDVGDSYPERLANSQVIVATMPETRGKASLVSGCAALLDK